MEAYTSHIREPLNLYSVFGYLLPGFFLASLFVIDYDLSSILRLNASQEFISLADIKTLDLKVNYILSFFSTGTLSDFKFIPFLVFLLFCYLLGHLISAFSSFFIERALVKWTMGFPAKVLVSEKQNFKWYSLFVNYRRPFNNNMLSNINDAVKATFKSDINKEDYYWLLYSYIITSRPYLAPRVHHFVNLYGFSRNVCATFILYILFRISFLNIIAGSKIDWAVWSVLVLFFVAAGFMFWNYLKLFKRQALDTYFLFLSVHNDKENILFKNS
jgi:hypothetical protein